MSYLWSKKYTVWLLIVFTLSLLTTPLWAASPKHKEIPPPESGPIIHPSGEEALEKKTDDHGLQRLGSFGKMHFFGYGELHYNGKIGPATNEIDFHRLVLGFGYDFTEKIKFRAELDFEHAFKDPELEFAYLDFNVRDWFNIRAGSILVPMGVINQHHEPPLFYSVERPEVYRVIIPTTWQEGGAGFFGHFGNGFDYELYAMSTPAAARISGGAIDSSFTGSSGIRDGRGHVGNQISRDFGAAGRLQYTGMPGLRLGTSAFVGNTGHGNNAIGGAFLTMLEADAKYSFQGIDLDGLVAFTNLSDAANLNNYLVSVSPPASPFTNFVAKQMLGWYLEAAYHVFHHILPETKHDLVVFGRYEDFNTQFKMPAGRAANPANNRNTLTVGASYMPIPQVAIKADYMANWNQANAGVDQFNLGLGFYY